MLDQQLLGRVKQALLPLSIGAATGAYAAPENRRIEGAVRGLGVGAGTEIGAGLGVMGGMGLGGLTGAGIAALLKSLGAMPAGLSAHDMTEGGMYLGAGAGGVGGAYGGFKGSKALMWDGIHRKDPVPASDKDDDKAKPKEKQAASLLVTLLRSSQSGHEKMGGPPRAGLGNLLGKLLGKGKPVGVPVPSLKLPTRPPTLNRPTPPAAPVPRTPAEMRQNTWQLSSEQASVAKQRAAVDPNPPMAWRRHPLDGVAKEPFSKERAGLGYTYIDRPRDFARQAKSDLRAYQEKYKVYDRDTDLYSYPSAIEYDRPSRFLRNAVIGAGAGTAGVAGTHMLSPDNQFDAADAKAPQYLPDRHEMRESGYYSRTPVYTDTQHAARQRAYSLIRKLTAHDTDTPPRQPGDVYAPLGPMDAAAREHIDMTIFRDNLGPKAWDMPK